MKTLNAGLTAHLETGVTTLCRCWMLERRDGEILGFTDHDYDLIFDSTVFRAASGLTASRVEHSLGLAVDELSVMGVLSNESLLEDELALGLYDEASITLWLVNWQEVSQRTIIKTGTVGEVVRSSHSFKAELRGLSHRLDAAQGRRYQFGCDADLGDARCGVDLTSSTYKGAGAVGLVTESGRVFQAVGLGAFTSEHFTRGRLVWTSGENVGVRVEVKRHIVSGGVHTIEVWLPSIKPIGLGDSFEITSGCDKQFATCKNRFSNTENFRGFPYMPGNDWVTTYPGEAEIMDGGSRYK